MESFFLNLSPSTSNQPAVARMYLAMAVVFFCLGGYGVFKEYTAGERDLVQYILPLLQMAIAIAYLFISIKRRKAGGTRYVQVTEERLELKLMPNQAPLTLLWDTISLLRVQHDRLIYRLSSGQTGEITFDTIPEEFEDAVRNAIREAGRKKGVSL
ncbi:hypothetical protein [Rufibacter roseus]|uniref:PH domain-containing protein n=1 Tax=Rufibacter roseus TaxID=1567108 RepID=A0ABW2DGG7_9BACT|nr:hypothetical protein [Rufibacter roseus]